VLDLTLPSVDLAPLLVGALLTDGGVTVRLTEVEAYAGADDPAAHAFIGPRPRTLHLFGPPGTLYCYLSHGLHTCGNVVCGFEGGGAAVLLRAGRVVAGLDIVRERRRGIPDAALARGPGNFGRALGWTLADSGRSFTAGDLELEPGIASSRVVAGPRVGVSVAHRRPWRFWAEGDPTVSAYRPSPRIVPGHLDW
jgi:DNA-3-methyladenine glycosylase